MTNSEIYRLYLAKQSELTYDELPTPDETNSEEVYLYGLCASIENIVNGPDHFLENAKDSADAAKGSEDHCEEIETNVQNIADAILGANGNIEIQTATTEKAGIVKPDGTTIKIAADGTISVDEVTVDNTTIVKSDEGVISLKDADTYAKTSDIPDISNLAEKSELLSVDNTTIVKSDEGVISLKDADTYAKTSDIPDINNLATKDEVPTFDNKETLDKLSESEDGKLLFDGEEIVSGGSSGDGTTNIYIGKDAYSEEEKVIGEYLGKPLYRKTIMGTTPSTATNVNSRYETSNTILTNADKLVNSKGYVLIAGSYRSVNSMVPYTDLLLFISTSIEKTDSNINLKCYSKYTNICDCDFNITLEYTKTTDAENSYNDSMLSDKIELVTNVTNNYIGKDVYSEEEKVVGVWTDGRPIYRKELITTVPSTDTNGTESTSYINIDAEISELLSNKFIVYTTNSIVTGAGNLYVPSLNGRLSIFYYTTNKTIMVINSVKSYSNCRIKITLEYTKTTDAENSYQDSMLSDVVSATTLSTKSDNYSTEERVIGSWIDGKPLYRRVFKFTNTAIVAKTSTLISLPSDFTSDNILVNSRIAAFNSDTNLGGSNAIDMWYSKSDNSWKYYTDSAWSANANINIYFILEYTKTTDAENSFDPSMLNNEYSSYLDNQLTDAEYETLFEE